MKSEDQFSREKGRSKASFSLLKSFHRARNKSATRERESKNNNNNNINTIDEKSIKIDDESVKINPDTNKVIIERLSRQSSRRDIHADYAARMSRRKRNDSQENLDYDEKISNLSWGSRPLRHKRTSLREMVKLKNKLKFERCDAIVSGGNTTNQDTDEKPSRDLSYSSALFDDITNKSSPRPLYLSSEYNIPTLQDSTINSRVSLNFDFPSKRASWSSNGQRLPAILSLPRQSPPPMDTTQEQTSSRRKRQTHGITYTSSSSECSSPEYGDNNKKKMRHTRRNYKQRPPNLLLDSSKRGHSRSVSDVLSEKPIKPQTPKPKFSPASSMKDLHFYFSMQNLEQRKHENNNDMRRSSSAMTRSLRDLQFTTHNIENKRHSLATVPIYTDTPATNNKKGPISPEIKFRRSRTRPLSAVASSLKLQTSVIPEHVAVDPVTSPSDVMSSSTSSTKSSTTLPRNSSLKDVPEMTCIKRSRISSECFEPKEYPFIATRPLSVLDCGGAYQQLQQIWREGRQFSSLSIPVDLDQLLTKAELNDGMTPELKHHATWSNRTDHVEPQTMLNNVFMPPETLWVEALFDHVTMDGEELGFNAGDVICVIDSSDSDWWWGCYDDKEGWVPASFVRVLVNQSNRRNTISTSTISIPSAVQNEDCNTTSAETSASNQPHHSLKQKPDCDVQNGQVSKYDVTKRMNMRANVVKEIVKSEKDFVNHLKNVIEGYLVRCQNRPEMFTDEQISTIFSNIEEIYELQQNFLATLESVYCKDEPYNSDIAFAFLKHKKDFEIYSTYCNNHPKAIAVLTDLLTSKRYSNFFETCRLRQGMISISLDGFLLTPVQKICKYPLQLAELLKYTRDCHPAANDVKEALDAMTSVARMINERKRQTECVEKIASWQHRILNWKGSDILSTSIELINSGLMYVLSAPRTKPHFRMAYLFDHQIVFCKKDILRKDIHYYKSRINLDRTILKSVNRDQDCEWLTSLSTLDGFDHTNTWKICSEDGATVSMMFCKNDPDVTKWIQSFKKERQLSSDDRRKETLISRDIKDAIIRSSSMKQNKADLVTNLHYRQRVKIMQGGGATENIFNSRNNFFNNIALKFAFLKRNNKQFESVM